MEYTGNTKRHCLEKLAGDVTVKFDRVQDVPGYTNLARNGHTDVINFLHNNLHDVDLCLQAAEHKVADTLVYNDHGELTSAVGWHVKQVLGQGKDGITFLGYRYNDTNRTNKTVKCLSKYAKQYLNHTTLFSKIYKTVANNNNNFFELYLAENYTYYHNSKPLKEVEDTDFDSVLPKLCRMNSWIIKNTGFAFWDFGFSSGKNYMFDNNSELRWIDYGGAGMVRCPNFQGIYEKNSSLPGVELAVPLDGKESLILADSDFLMCQFLLHIEYWKNRGSTNTDVWSSMLQIRRSVAHDFVEMIPTILSTELTQGVYNKFKKHNWTDDITWKQVGKYINANT